MFKIDWELEAQMPEAREFENNDKDTQQLNKTELQ
jgi:hypothetical protein